MFDNLTDHLQGALKTIRGDAKLTADNIEEAIGDVRRALLEADVSLKVVKLFISRVRQKALGTEVLDSISPDQQFVKVVYDEMVTILGGENVPLDLQGKPAIVMLLGLQGSGKTTACGKLAQKLKKEGQNPLLVACDVQRPAAIKQLETLGQQIGVPVFTIPDSKDVQDIGEKAVEEAEQKGYNPVILDTAGRLQIDTDLMAELLILDRSLKPKEKILIVDSMTGQEAVNVAETFNTQLDVTGLLLTKVDGDARGGAALSVREAVGKPVKYLSTGEKLDQLEAFYPDRMASRILGMGDVLTLVERAQENINEKEAEKAAQRMLTEDFNLEMFVQMQKMMKKMGPMGDVMKMMGIGGMLGLNSEVQDKIAVEGEAKFRLYERAINSMTVAERQKPQIIDMSRRRRIAKGAGMKDSEVGQMLNEFEQMRQMMAQVRKMFGAFGGGGANPFGMGMPDLGDMDLGAGLPGLFGGGQGAGRGRPGMPQGMPQLPMRPPKGPPKGGPPSGYYRKKKKR
ncbi:MAG: signal recognition particle protein [Candidatus Melainabacteria bacterium]|nr:MAG: signal recognition particle protein [Candidatus Melainabacteria bacterium]